jgi:predicted kinase
VSRREKHDDATVTVLVAGTRCRSCDRSMLFHPLLNEEGRGRITTDVIHKALWAIGAAEVAPGMWHCWVCICEYPRTKLAAEAVRPDLVRPQVLGVSETERMQWGRR